MGKRPELTIEAIRQDHVRDTFDCGKLPLNEYLAKHARQNHERGTTKTFVGVHRPDLAVLGYYSLCMGNVSVVNFPAEEVKRFPRYPVPVVHLARLAIDRRVQRQGLGSLLLVSALKRALKGSHEIGAYAVEALAKDEEARTFYLKYGFKQLVDDRLHLYISMKTVEDLP